MGEARRIVVARTGEGIPTVAVDVDRTLIDDDENLIPGAKEALNYLRAQGWKVILWTSRADLDHVKELCKKYGLEYDHLNENPEADQREYTRKIRFNATVDDKAVPFNGEWPPVVSELDRRRDLWRLDGMTKATVNLMLSASRVFGIVDAARAWLIVSEIPTSTKKSVAVA